MKRPKKEPRFEYARLIADGEVVFDVDYAILPDSHNQEAKRWKAWKEAGRDIRTRSQLAASFRRWRRMGWRSEKGVPRVASMIRYMIHLALEEKGGAL
jgi:hypothetical protein